jgi:hypothetical protein
VYKFSKVLYGLKQTLRAWYARLDLKTTGTFFSGLVSKSVATVFSSLTSKSVVTIFHWWRISWLGLKTKVVEGFPVWASKTAVTVW